MHGASIEPKGHVCPNNAWPTGHPLPPVDPAKLTGPEVGEFVMYQNKYRPNDGAVVVKVLERSYVWSPGECRHKGGYRRYDWTVIEVGPDRYRAVVVDDTDLSPLPDKAHITYGLRIGAY
jgi:hypothetical protein